MTFFDPSEWDGKLYSGGWARGSGGDQQILEPATGESLGRTSRERPASPGLPRGSGRRHPTR